MTLLLVAKVDLSAVEGKLRAPFFFFFFFFFCFFITLKPRVE